MTNPLDVCQEDSGALDVLQKMLNTQRDIVTSAAFDNLARRGLTGSLIYIAYSDVCGKDISKLLDRLDEENDDFEKEVFKKSRGE